MSCKNADLIFTLRQQISDLQRKNEGIETAIRLHAAGAGGEIQRLQKRVDDLEGKRVDFENKSDDELRAILRAAGGHFHGPKVEHLSIPEADVFKFLRSMKVQS